MFMLVYAKGKGHEEKEVTVGTAEVAKTDLNLGPVFCRDVSCSHHKHQGICRNYILIVYIQRTDMIKISTFPKWKIHIIQNL